MHYYLQSHCWDILALWYGNEHELPSQASCPCNRLCKSKCLMFSRNCSPLYLSILKIRWVLSFLSLTFIEMNALIGPDCTWIPEWLTSMTLASKTSPCSGMQAIALKLTLKMTSPLVSWINPSPIYQYRSSFYLFSRSMIYPYCGWHVPTKVFSILDKSKISIRTLNAKSDLTLFWCVV